MSDSQNTTESRSEQNDYFLSEGNYQRLQNLQKEIYQSTAVTPSMKKLVNLILNQSDVEHIKHQLMELFNEI